MDFSIEGIVTEVLKGSPVAILLLVAIFLGRHISYLQTVISTKDEQILKLLKESFESTKDQTEAITSVKELLAEFRGQLLSRRKNDE